MKKSADELVKIAAQIRIESIKMISQAGSGHPGGSLSSADILSVLYFNIMNYNLKNPKDPKRDYFILSKGHGCPALYAALALAGYFPKEELSTLRKFGSRLQGHPDMLKLPFLEASTGSLGQGLSIAVGIALAHKIKAQPNRVYCLMGDGEVDEGNVWEAAMFASMHKLGNLIAIIDRNRIQLDGFCKDIMDTEPLADKWNAFGWHIISVDGHDIPALLNAFEEAKKVKSKPVMLIAQTTKGKGVSFMENNPEFHGKAPAAEQTKKALEELQKI